MSQKLSNEDQETLLEKLEARFLKHMERHPEITWAEVEEILLAQPKKIAILNEMEKTGGEPDVVGKGDVFIDCAPESPKGRRSICYDRPALEARKKHKPANDAQTLSTEIGIEMLTEEEYYELQSYGEFDLKSSSWVQTPAGIRELGGAIYCDRRYDRVFTYHNGAESYYGARGFRGKLKI